MKLPIHYFLFLILSVGCSKEIISISVLEPAEVIIPHEIERISIFPIAGPPDSLGQFLGLKHFPLSKNLNYNIAKMGYVYGIYDILVESPRFQRVVISDSTYLDSLLTGNMTIKHLREICRTDSTDAVLVIIKVESSDWLDYTEYDDISNPRQYNYFVTGQLAIYEPGLPNGTLIFNFQDNMIYDAYKNLYPERAFRILSEMCYFAGNNIGIRLAPGWKEQERMLIKGMSTALKTSVKNATQGQWEEAAVIWNKLSESKLKRLAAKASYNMAVAWEQSDDLNQALYWINHADSLHHRKDVDEYKSLVLKRIENKATIDLQMPVN